jgi:hypothetical protein
MQPSGFVRSANSAPNYDGMKMQSAGFVRSANPGTPNLLSISNAMGFTRSAKSVDKYEQQRQELQTR